MAQQVPVVGMNLTARHPCGPPVGLPVVQAQSAAVGTDQRQTEKSQWMSDRGEVAGMSLDLFKDEENPDPGGDVIALS
jgi:hypothetical protein